MNYTILLFYKYVEIPDPQAVMHFVRGLCNGLGLKGRAIIAAEGVNMTLEGSAEHIKAFIETMQKDLLTKKIAKQVDWKTSEGSGQSFPRLSVKVRPEIVALNLGKDDINPRKVTGKYLSPEDLNALYEKQDDFVVVDMRNDYEYKVGHFRNSVNPGLENFRDLPKVLPKLENLKDKKVVTVCTGGVRCEKASGFLKKNGFNNVYQLHGGMHRYMEKFGHKDFLGKLYVFDGRVAVGEDGKHEVVGRCDVCRNHTERYENCHNALCHKHLLICDSCCEANGVYCAECITLLKEKEVSV
jgi:UPF0176 protein